MRRFLPPRFCLRQHHTINVVNNGIAAVIPIHVADELRAITNPCIFAFPAFMLDTCIGLVLYHKMLKFTATEYRYRLDR